MNPLSHLRSPGTIRRHPSDRIEGPTITVLMPVRNGGRWIGAALESVRRQTYRPFEILVVDDGSDDDTVSVVRSVGDSRLRILEKPATGLADSLNAGLRCARGDWIARLDADDVAEPTRFEQQIALLHRHPDVVLLGCNAVLMDESGSRLWPARYPQRDARLRRELLACRGLFPHSSAMYPRNLALAVGGYEPRFTKSQDTDFWFRLARHGRLGCVQRTLLRVRKHDQAVSESTVGFAQFVYGLAAVARELAWRQYRIDLLRHMSDAQWAQFLGEIDEDVRRAGCTRAMTERQMLRAAAAAAPGRWHLAVLSDVLKSPVRALAILEPVLRRVAIRRVVCRAHRWARMLAAPPDAEVPRLPQRSS